MRPPFFLTCILILISTITTLAQPPEQFTYQAVIRDSNNTIIRNTTIGLRLSVLRDSSTSITPLYSETHNLTTNSNGLITTEIGGGTVESGDFSSIMWGDGIYFIKTEIDLVGGTDYGISGVTRVLSVPYALYSNRSQYSDTSGVTVYSDSARVANTATYSDSARVARLLPRMTTSQRDSIQNPEQGLQIFNLTTGCLELNMGSPTNPEWFQLGCLGTVDSLLCDSSVVSQRLTFKTPTDGRTVTIPYTNGNSGDFPEKVFQSQVVDGLSLRLLKGRVRSGDDNLTLEFSGTPQDTGTALFLIDVVTKSCSLEVYVDVARVDSILCDVPTISNLIVEGDSVDSISIQLSYLGGDGGYLPRDTIESTEVLGMTAIIDSGYLSVGDGSIQINLKGFPMGNGVGYFPIAIGSKICSLGIYVIDSSTAYYPTGYVHCDTQNPTEVVEVLNPTTGKIWMDRNLGASRVATSHNDVEAYGDLYQWGRFADGHQCRDSEATNTNASTAVANAGNVWDGKFIVEGTLPNDWMIPQNSNLWQGINGLNNPCPNGFRLPNEAEWEAERQSWGSNNTGGAFGSPLRLPVSGHRSAIGQGFWQVGYYGYYWSSSVSGSNARNLDFYSSNAGMNSNARAGGSALRCIKEMTYYPDGYVHCDPLNPTEVVEVLNPTTNKIWMDRNLGASRVATSYNDEEAYGDLFQWGRFADGHQCRDSDTTNTIATTTVPNEGNLWDGKFIVPRDFLDENWLTPIEDNLWQETSGVNNPCPSGYRLPTNTELEAERLSWSQNNSTGAFNSPLKLPVSGYRFESEIVLAGSNSACWSSSVSGSRAGYMSFYSNAANGWQERWSGLTVRCIKD